MKKTRFMFLVCLVSSFLMASIASAAVGPYMSGQVGATWLEDADITSPGDPAIESSFDMGFNVGASGGFDFGPARVEGELTYRQNDYDELSDAGFSIAADGDVSALSLLVNGFWDIETGGPVTPYLGAGIGVAQVSINDLGILGISLADDDDTVFAYQFAAGAAFELNPNIALDLGYRYFATADPEFDDAEGTTFESEYASHNLNLGLRFMF